MLITISFNYHVMMKIGNKRCDSAIQRGIKVSGTKFIKKIFDQLYVQNLINSTIQQDNKRRGGKFMWCSLNLLLRVLLVSNF
jgi:hypothetical protein